MFFSRGKRSLKNKNQWGGPFWYEMPYMKTWQRSNPCKVICVWYFSSPFSIHMNKISPHLLSSRNKIKVGKRVNMGFPAFPTLTDAPKYWKKFVTTESANILLPNKLFLKNEIFSRVGYFLKCSSNTAQRNIKATPHIFQNRWRVGLGHSLKNIVQKTF